MSTSPHAFAATSNVVMTSGSGAGQSCVAANNCFSPNVVNIAVGDTVTWTNTDTVGHTTTSGLPSDNTVGTVWDSSLVNAGKTFSFTFQSAGIYYYFCMVHPWMIGEVAVGQSPQPLNTPPPLPTPTPTPTPPPQPNPSSTNLVVMSPGAGSDQSCVAAQNCFSPSVIQVAVGTTVTWQNNDKVGHTTTSGNPTDNTTGTIWDSSLVNAGKTYSFTFQNAGDYKYFCMVHPWMTGEVIVGNGISPTPQQITVTTDKPTYNAGELVSITIQSPSFQSGQSVAIMVTDPSGNIISSRTITVSQSSGTLQIGLQQGAQTGTYQITATSSSSGTLFKGVNQFTVTSSSTGSQITIVSVQATNQQGSPVSSFSKGTTGFAKVILSSQSTQTALITVNLVGADSTSLGVGTIKLPLNQGQTEIQLSFFIPSNTAGGSGTIYTDVFSDFPTNGGTPLTGEASASVSIG